MVVPFVFLFVLLSLYHLPAVLPPIPISPQSLPLGPYSVGRFILSGIYEGLATRTSGSTIQKPTKRGETWLFEVNLPTGPRVASSSSSSSLSSSSLSSSSLSSSSLSSSSLSSLSSLSSSSKQPSFCVRQCVVSRGARILCGPLLPPSLLFFLLRFPVCPVSPVFRVACPRFYPPTLSLLSARLGADKTSSVFSRRSHLPRRSRWPRHFIVTVRSDFHDFPDWPGSRAKVDPSSVRADKLRERVTPHCDLHSTRTPTYLGVFRRTVSVLRSTRGKLTGKGWGWRAR